MGNSMLRASPWIGGHPDHFLQTTVSTHHWVSGGRPTQRLQGTLLQSLEEACSS